MLSRNNPIGATSYAAASILDVALNYARDGLYIFPCDPKTKKPLTGSGFKDASRDEKQIIAFWTAYPNAMIGMPTGEINGVFVFDVDLDPAKNVNGFVILAGMVTQRGELPTTLTTITPRGGRHLIYKWRPGFTLRNRAGVPGPGCDVRANGGYIILPPSTREDGVAYQWEENGALEPVDAPDWFIALISPQKASTGRGKKEARKNSQRDLIWAHTALEEECKLIAAAPYGQRNNQLNTSAFNIFQIVWGNPGLLDEEGVRQQLFAAAEESSLVEDDGAGACWRTIDSAAEGARGNPRTRPERQAAVPARLDLSKASATFGAGAGTSSSAGPNPSQARIAPSVVAVPDPRRIVQLRDGFKSFALDEVEDELVKQGGFGIYQRGGQLVRTVLVRTKDSDNRSTLIWRLEPVDTSHVLEVFSRIVEFQHYDRRSKAWVPTDCSLDLPRMYEARRHWEVPTLLGVVHTPQLRADGSLVVAQGYDAGTRLLFKFDGEVFPSIPARPTKEDALAALEMIEEAIKTFPFKADVDRSVLLSLFLTVLCRRSFDLAPLHGISAPTPGTGKSLLVSLASILASGQTAPVIALGRNDEEFRKTLTSSLMAATPIIAIDNCMRPLTGDLLCSVVTEERSDLRRLGHSRNILVQSNSLITATGNNLAIGSDMSRRVLLCSIDAGIERPEKRVFQGVAIKKLFRQRRGELVAALLTVLRAARLAQPEIERMQLAPLGGFEEWCVWVRDPLVWLGRADPCASIESSYENNIDREETRAVLCAWRDHIGLQVEVRTQELIDRANQLGTLGGHLCPSLREALLMVAEERGVVGNLSAKRLGWWLRKTNGHPVDGLRVVKTRSPQGYPHWQLQT